MIRCVIAQECLTRFPEHCICVKMPEHLYRELYRKMYETKQEDEVARENRT